MTISIREATLSDVPDIARIGSSAFNDEPIYEHFFPFRSLYPQHYYQYFVNDAKMTLNTPGRILVVAELDEDTGDHSRDEVTISQKKRKVIGYASFIRTGSSEEIAKWNPDTWFKRLSRLVLGLRQWVNSYLFPNRAVSPAAMSDYYTQAQRIHAKYLAKSNEKIEFRTLAVDVDHQRQGVGQKLMAWCAYRASTEQVPVFGDASSKGLSLYLRNGGRDIGRISLPEQVVPSSDEPTGKKIEALDVIVLRWVAAGRS